MKRTKSIARLLALILVLCMVLIPMVSCNGMVTILDNTPAEETPAEETPVARICTVVVATDPETVYTVDLNEVGAIEDGLMTVLDFLKEESGLTYEVQASTYGAFLTKVLTLDSASITNGYICLFTSVEGDFDVSMYATEMNYNGTKLVTSGLGASSMAIEADAVYYICLSSY